MYVYKYIIYKKLRVVLMSSSLDDNNNNNNNNVLIIRKYKYPVYIYKTYCIFK